MLPGMSPTHHERHDYERRDAMNRDMRRSAAMEFGSRSMSIESRDDMSYMHGKPQRGQPLPPSPGASTLKSKVKYPPRFPYTHRKLPTRGLQSVVTSSFSVEEERDDNARSVSRGVSRELSYDQRRHYSGEGRRESDSHMRDDWEKSSPSNRGAVYFAPTTPSPRHNMGAPSASIQRAYSSSGYFAPQDAMKRSYYHHSASRNQYMDQLPADFMPPTKRSRSEAPREDVVISPRHSNHHDQGMVHRSHSFPVPPSWNTHRGPSSAMEQHLSSPIHQVPGHMSYRPSYHAGSSQKIYAQVSPGSDIEDSPQSYTPEQAWHASPHSRHSHFWDSPRNKHEIHRQHGILKRDEATPDCRSDKMRMMVEAAAVTGPTYENNPSNEPTKNMVLLALSHDRGSLSETLCVVRENIEVFTASQKDVDAPAPGRKHAVVVGQVGLRCIHCRHTTRCSDRVKRAVCYPSSIKRIYRTVIDMKLDHFSQCKFVPAELKSRLDELKAIHTRSTGTTMQYFIHAAHSLGMEDGKSGVVLRESIPRGSEVAPKMEIRHKVLPPPPPPPQPTSTLKHKKNPRPAAVKRCDSMSSSSWISNSESAPTPRIDTMSSGSFDAAGNFPMEKRFPLSPMGKSFEGLIPLALTDDKAALSPLRCFLREQVCAFSATETDIAVRAPTTFSISVGQVGIGCIHCVRQVAKLRSNRAVCFPFSIGRIYQSVADIQRFHFGECKMMPSDVKEKFLKLQGASSKGSKGLATRQYWVTSARKLGLIDTSTGIRFGRDPYKVESKSSFSLDILAQAAFSVTTASKQLVLPEDKPCIAEFLYVVMEQLQPCRFTEADRNKRRLKDVGCIGVECKHCAGQVDSRKFFWSSVSAVESNFVSVHTHMLECRAVPAALKERLFELKQLRKEQTALLRTGSQKAFFARVWKRLHEDESGAAPNPAPAGIGSRSMSLDSGERQLAPSQTARHQYYEGQQERSMDYQDHVQHHQQHGRGRQRNPAFQTTLPDHVRNQERPLSAKYTHGQQRENTFGEPEEQSFKEKVQQESNHDSTQYKQSEHHAESRDDDGTIKFASI